MSDKGRTTVLSSKSSTTGVAPPAAPGNVVKYRHEEIISCISALDEVLAQFDDSSLPFIPPEDDNTEYTVGLSVADQARPNSNSGVSMDQNQNWNGSESVVVRSPLKLDSSQMIQISGDGGGPQMSQSFTAGMVSGSSPEVNGNCFGGTYSKGTSCDLIVSLGKGTVTTSSHPQRPSIIMGEVTPQGKIRSTLNMALFSPSPPVTRKLPDLPKVTTVTIPGNIDEQWNFHSDKNLPRSLRKTRKTCFLEEGDTSFGSRSESPFCSESSTLEQSGASDLVTRSPRIPRSLIPGRCEIINKGDGNFALECGPRGRPRKLPGQGSTSSPCSTFTTSSGVSLSVTSGQFTSEVIPSKGRPRQQLPSPSRTPQVPPPTEPSSVSPLEIRDEEKDTSQESLGGDPDEYLSSSNTSPLKTCHPDILMRNKDSDTDFEETCSDSKLVGARKRDEKHRPPEGNLNGSLPNQTQMMRMMMMLKTPKTNSIGSGSSSTRSSSSSSGSVSVKSSSSEDCGGGDVFHEKIVEDYPPNTFGGTKDEPQKESEEEEVVVVLRPKRELGRGGIPLLQQGRDLAQGGAGFGLEIDDGYLSMINRNETGPLWPEEFIENETFSKAELKRLSVNLEEETRSEEGRRERRSREKTDYFSDDSLEEDGTESKDKEQAKEEVVVIKQSTSFVIPFHSEVSPVVIEGATQVQKASPVKKSNSHVSRIPKPAGIPRRKSSCSKILATPGVCVRKPCSFFIPLSDPSPGGSDRKLTLPKLDTEFCSGLSPNNQSSLRSTSLPSSRRNSETLQGGSSDPPKSLVTASSPSSDKASKPSPFQISSSNPEPSPACSVTPTNTLTSIVTVTTPEINPPETTPDNMGDGGGRVEAPSIGEEVESKPEQILIESCSRGGSVSPPHTLPTGPGQRLSAPNELADSNDSTTDKTVTKTNPDKCDHLNQVLSVWEEYSSGPSEKTPTPKGATPEEPPQTSETIKEDLDAVVKMFLAATEGLLEPSSFEKTSEELPTFNEAAEIVPIMTSTPKTSQPGSPTTPHIQSIDLPVSSIFEEDDQPPTFIPDPPPVALEPLEVPTTLPIISLNPAPQTEQPLDLLSQKIARCPSPVENMSVSQFLHNKKNIWAMYDRPYDEDVLPPSFPRGYASRSQENLIDAMSHERLSKSFSARGQSSTLPLNCRPPPVQRRTSTFRNMFNKFRKHKATDPVIPECQELRDEEVQSVTSRETGPSEGKKRSFFSRLFRRSRKH